MDPRFLYMIVRQDQQQQELRIARERLARSPDGRRHPRGPRRALGRMLVRAGMWLMVSHVASSAH